tara:strand:+ start:32 stop:748 length:717 start_codon:yes stop_codon:yes gene_type:complete
MKITLPDDFRKIVTQPNYVEDGINQYWNINEDYIKTWLGGYLLGNKTTYEYFKQNDLTEGFSTDLDNPLNGLGAYRANLRHPLGYTALPKLTSSSLGFQLWSEPALRLRQTVTNPKATGCLTSFLPESGLGSIITDHFTGTTAAAACIFKTYRDSNWDLDYILNEWLPSQLINYITVLIRHEEHQEDKKTGQKGISRGNVFTLEQKMAGEHYSHAGVPLPLRVTNEHAEEIIGNNFFD